MTIFYRFLSVLSIIVTILFIILLLRAFFVSNSTYNEAHALMSVDDIAKQHPDAVSHFSTAISIPTISDPHFYHKESFFQFRKFIDQSYPEINKKLIKKQFGSGALLYEWRGKQPEKPVIILMSHYDVVPIEKSEEPKWSEKPFSGLVKNGYVWGRGSIDDKFGVIAILEAVNYLLKNGYQPTNSIYLAFGADEEIGGLHGNALIAKHLSKLGIKAAYVLDEGLPINQGIIPGVKHPVATIAITEKGYMSVRLVSTGKSGHSSLPIEDNAINKLIRVMTDLEQHPLEKHWNPILDDMFQKLLPDMSFRYRIAFANLWLTRSLVSYSLAKTPLTKALISTTISPTIIRAGIKDNVLPATAEAIINFRLNAGDSIERTLSHINTLARPQNVVASLYGEIHYDPTPNADINSKGFKSLTEAIHSVFPSAVVTPSIMLGSTDSRFYLLLTQNIFRFYPLPLTREDISGIHGCNERIAINAFLKAILFYEELIKKSA